MYCYKLLIYYLFIYYLKYLLSKLLLFVSLHNNIAILHISFWITTAISDVHVKLACICKPGHYSVWKHHILSLTT